MALVIADRPLALLHRLYMIFNIITESSVWLHSSIILLKCAASRKNTTAHSAHITINPRYAASTFATIIPMIIIELHIPNIMRFRISSAIQYPVTASGNISIIYCPKTDVFPKVERKLYILSVVFSIAENIPNRSAPINCIIAKRAAAAPPTDAVNTNISSRLKCFFAVL